LYHQKWRIKGLEQKHKHDMSSAVLCAGNNGASSPFQINNSFLYPTCAQHFCRSSPPAEILASGIPEDINLISRGEIQQFSGAASIGFIGKFDTINCCR
jgi:hypothetical protein